jgi:proteic killer suppression protein
MDSVIFNKKALKALKKLPTHIVRNLQLWIFQVESLGISDVRKIPGYHDEPLTGNRKGQRSTRLSRSYRAIYIENEECLKDKTEVTNIIEVIEVNKHEY